MSGMRTGKIGLAAGLTGILFVLLLCLGTGTAQETAARFDFKGLVAEVKVYSRALSGEEVAAQYEQ